MPVDMRQPAKARKAAARPSPPASAAVFDPLTGHPARPATDRLLRFDQVQAKVGLGRTLIYGAIKRGAFPRPVQLIGRTVAWRESELDAWIAALPRARELPPCA